MENFMIRTKFLKEKDAKLFGEEPFELLDLKATMLDILVKAGIFPSKTIAKKNWQGSIEIPPGFTQITAGKLKKEIAIWNPFL